VPTADKIRLVEMLAHSGLRRLEVTSFVRADVIPQLADAREVLEAIDVPDEVALSVLIPNKRGLEHALALRERFQEINVFLSASEEHNRRNVNRSIEESLSGLERVLNTASEADLHCEGTISVSFGCPYEGYVPPERVWGIARRLMAAGAQEIGFGDTTGMANPAQVRAFFAQARDALATRSSSPPTSTTRVGRGSRTCWPRWTRGRLVRVELRRARRLPGPRRRDGQRRDGGRRLDAARDGHRNRHPPRRPARGLACGAGGARPPARLAPAHRRPGGVELLKAPLAPLTTLRLGGPAARLVEAHTEAELCEAVRSAYEPLLVLAGGSNVVIADEGFRGTVVHVHTRGIERDGARLTVQAGEPWEALVDACVAEDLQGFECLAGIPGSTGATPIQNVGAYGQEVAETVESVRVLDRASGRVEEMPAEACGFRYRGSVFKYRDRRVVLAVTFRLRASGHSGPLRYAELARRLDVPVGGSAPLAEVREAVLALRRRKGMVIDPADPDSVSAGSFFTNRSSTRRRSRRSRSVPVPTCDRPRSPSRTGGSRARPPG
jgi:UDP-N-acetylenolpyruvoylglucosamine reductase